MGGENPYHPAQNIRAAAQPYRVIVKEGARIREIQVDPARIPYGGDGLPGSLLDILLAHDVAVDHACGGVAACSTCHVHVTQGLESCNEVAEVEADQLDYAPDCRPNSRLACQCVPDGSREVVVEIPGWNRNAAREEH